MNKFFNGRKYFLEPKSNRWFRTTGGSKRLSHDVWNYYHPNDPILKGDGYVIDHINEDSSDDRVENLRKMTNSKHNSMHKIGNQNWLDKHHSTESKQKIREANLGRIVSEETKQKISEAMIGNKNPNFGKHWSLTEETKQKMSEAKLGNKNPNFGKHWSDETKRKMSKSRVKYLRKISNIMRETNVN